jgi:DNA-binding protein Fis
MKITIKFLESPGGDIRSDLSGKPGDRLRQLQRLNGKAPFIYMAMKKSDQNQVLAANLLGISRNTFRDRLKK